MNIAKPFCLQGHRGARGLYPENTLIGFIEALRSGLNTLEMDVVISADGKVVVSHEAWMNDIICSLPNGAPLEKGSGKQYNLYQMPYSEIRRFDCGKRGHPRFPMQQAIPAYKPLLSEVMDTLEAYSKEKALGELYYNIELKTASEDTLLIQRRPPMWAGVC